MKSCLLACSLTVSMALAGMAGAQTIHSGEYDPQIYSAVEEAVEILKSEIKRDEWAISSPMNVQRLRDVRDKLSEDLPKKEKTLKTLQKSEDKELSDIVKMFSKTAEDEREIADSPRVTHSSRRGAYNTIKENLPGKKEALETFEKWLER